MKEDRSDILNLGTKSPIKIHLIGVAGSGMSGIAGLLLSLGHTVSGSDKADTKETERLIKLGLTFCGAHSPEQVYGVDLVVYSSAIKQGNVVYDKAKELGIPMIRRAEALAAIMSDKKSIIVPELMVRQQLQRLLRKCSEEERRCPLIMLVPRFLF